jgi:hypothetical protein
MPANVYFMARSRYETVRYRNAAQSKNHPMTGPAKASCPSMYSVVKANL